jgi:hypothetical protein
MRGVICCAAAALAVLAATAGGASADRGGVKHVTVLHPDAPSAAVPVQVALRNAGAFRVDDTQTKHGTREFVTLASPSAPRSLVYDVQLAAGITAMQLGPRAVAFVHDGVQVAVFVAPAMTDASGAISRALEATVHGSTIHVTPSAAWLESAQYPVTIDPDVLTMQGANQDTYIESGSPDGYFAGDPQLLVGNDGTQSVRGLLNFQVDANIPAGATIDNAQLSLYLESASTAATSTVTVANVVAPWSDATWRQYDYSWQTGAPLLWTTPGGDTESTGVASAAVAPTPGTTTNWDVSQLVQRQVSGLVQSDGFLVRAQDETTPQLLGFTSSWSWSGNALPTLTVTWESGTVANAPAVSITTGNSVTFGTAGVGSTTPTQEVDVENSGSAPLTVSSLAIGGTNASDFAITGQTCMSAAVQPGGICTVTLSATPSAAGNRTAALVITDNAPNSPQNVALSVNGQVPVSATYSPVGGITFPATKVGKTSGTQYVTVKSTGQSALAISSVTLGGPNPGDFSIVSNSCSGARLASGTSCQIGIRAKPTVRYQYRDATLKIVDNDANGGASMPLEVYGT